MQSLNSLAAGDWAILSIPVLVGILLACACIPMQCRHRWPKEKIRRTSYDNDGNSHLGPWEATEKDEWLLDCYGCNVDPHVHPRPAGGFRQYRRFRRCPRCGAFEVKLG